MRGLLSRAVHMGVGGDYNLVRAGAGGGEDQRTWPGRRNVGPTTDHEYDCRIINKVPNYCAYDFLSLHSFLFGSYQFGKYCSSPLSSSSFLSHVRFTRSNYLLIIAHIIFVNFLNLIRETPLNMSHNSPDLIN